MTDTANLGLPFIEASQAQKHVTHNEALRIIDAAVQVAVQDVTRTAPPTSPADGQRHIVAASPTGAWAGRARAIATWQDGAWAFLVPKNGWCAWSIADAGLLVFDGTLWRDLRGLAIDNAARVGVNTTASSPNLLSVKSNASLFAAINAADGGSGDVRVQLSKETTAKTASMFFASAYSGRAEFGLVGSNEFRLKVSNDGSAWSDALVVDPVTAVLSLPRPFKVNGVTARETLGAARTYYVRTDGNDANSGLANSAAGAFATLQRAADVIFGTIDLGGFNVTVQVGSGSYSEGVIMVGAQVGAGRVIFTGNNASPGSVVVTSTTHYVFRAEAGAFFTVRDMEIASSNFGGLLATRGGRIYFSNLRLGVAGIHHIRADDQGLIFCEGSYTIVGNSAQTHWIAISSGVIRILNWTITLSGTPSFGTAFAIAQAGGAILASANTFSGAATGSRYTVDINGLIYVSGAGPTYFPGSTAGTASNGGQYV